MEVKDDWTLPQVSQSVSDIFDKGNWTMENPSPLCECSCEGRKRMLPECPAGAGGLPPPQVSKTNKNLHTDSVMATKRYTHTNSTWHTVMKYHGLSLYPDDDQ